MAEAWSEPRQFGSRSWAPKRYALYSPSWSIVRTLLFILCLFLKPQPHLSPYSALFEFWQAEPYLQHLGSLSLWLPAGLGQCKGWQEIREWAEDIYSALRSFSAPTLPPNSSSLAMTTAPARWPLSYPSHSPWTLDIPDSLSQSRGVDSSPLLPISGCFSILCCWP